MLPLYLHIGRTEDKRGCDRYLRLTLSNDSSGLVAVCSLCNSEKDCTGKDGGQYSHSSHFFIYHLSGTGSTEHEIGLLMKKRAGSPATRFSLPYLSPSLRCNFPLYSLILEWAEEK